MSAILQVENLSVSFAGFQAIRDVSFTMDQGAIYSVIGPNGAGKSTLFNLITGLNKPDQGRVLYMGKDIGGVTPERRCHMGMGRSFQRSNIFSALSVFENVQTAIVARQRENWRMFFPLGQRHREEAEKILREVGLAEKIDHPVTALSHGDCRQLELALALALKPQLLLLDEPTAGMSVVETRRCVELLQNIVSVFGVKLLLTEHDMSVVFAISDRIMVLSQGQNIAFGTPDEIRNSSVVRSTYLGHGPL
ncbi:ABC transporter ATP-binding protein [Massilia sp. W12]|uniref:ABC transporter ATP-binding protein n=1 Tax=Massilia sp. W12 TaxID=3126507 RepID=UPI0030CE65B5